MRIYFWILQIAAMLGHRKARLIVRGQSETLARLRKIEKQYLLEKEGQTTNTPKNTEGFSNTNNTEWFSSKKRKGTEGMLDLFSALDIQEDNNRAKSLQGAIWIHAASVGEFEQARPLIELIRRRQPQQKILLTFFSSSGYEMRKNYDQVDWVVYLPFATRKNARAFLDIVRPSMAIFVKYEFWPAYLQELRKRCIRTYLICGIFDKSQHFFRWYGAPYRRLLECFTRLYVQDKDSMRLLKSYGIMHVDTCGDTRFDRVNAVCRAHRQIPIAEAFALQRHTRVLVAGSTWPEDEVLLARYVRENPDVRLILVPHEINEEHLDRIFHTFRGRVAHYTRTNEKMVVKAQTLVVDTMGMLSSLYQYGQVAYVGGGFGAGIHNTLEPAVYGIPVVFGPKYKSFREARNLVRQSAALSAKDYPSLKEALDRAFIEQIFMGTAANEYCRSELGATEAIYRMVF